MLDAILLSTSVDIGHIVDRDSSSASQEPASMKAVVDAAGPDWAGLILSENAVRLFALGAE